MGNSKAYFKMIPELADHFNVSVDYLLGRGDRETYNLTNITNSVVSQGNNSKSTGQSIFFKNSKEEELLRIFRLLTVKEQNKILNYAFTLEEEFTDNKSDS